MNVQTKESLRQMLKSRIYHTMRELNRYLPKEEAIALMEQGHAEFTRQIEILKKKRIRKGAAIHYIRKFYDSGDCGYSADADNSTTDLKKVTCKKCLEVIKEEEERMTKRYQE